MILPPYQAPLPPNLKLKVSARTPPKVSFPTPKSEIYHQKQVGFQILLPTEETLTEHFPFSTICKQ